MEELEKENQILKDTIANLENKIEEKNQEIEKLKDWMEQIYKISYQLT